MAGRGRCGPLPGATPQATPESDTIEGWYPVKSTARHSRDRIISLWPREAVLLHRVCDSITLKISVLVREGRVGDLGRGSDTLEYDHCLPV